MKILFSVHLYPPAHLCGAEMYAVKMAKMMLEMGHQVRVYLHRFSGSTDEKSVYRYEGVDVFPPISDAVKDGCFEWADLIITHLDFTQYTIVKAGRLGKPVIFIVHNTSHFYDNMINHNDNTFVIYNSEDSKRELNYQRPSMVMEPQIDLERIKIDSNSKEYYTLINICENKGVRQFYEIARLMPDKKFLGVKGSYMDQETDCPPNVTIWDKQEDIREVYKVTKVLLMPSDYESFGMTASEAMANGIPVICSPTPGLKENCGDGAQYLDRKDVNKWVSLLRKLDTPKEYDKWSRAGLNRTAIRKNKYNELQDFLNECHLQR